MASSDAERWRRILDLADEALDQPESVRESWLRTACGDDSALLAAVLALLEAGERPDAFLGSPVAPLAARLSLDPTSPELLRIGPYRVVRELGRGGMGTVYLAEREEHFEQRVALKVVKPGLHLDETLVRRFVEERQMLASLEHANIARLIDGGLTGDGLPWFAMEFVEGEPIDRWCDERRLAIDARIELFCAVCDAVEYAHQRHIVHRDIKPSNVLVRSDGTVKLLDFGIAKLLAPDRTASPTLTHPGPRFLTPDYASPEQARGDTVSSESDVYSLGILLYELICGRLPATTAAEAGSSGRDGTLPPSVAARRDVTGGARGRMPATSGELARARGTTVERLSERLRGELDRVVLKALESRPSRRYRSAGEFARDLRRNLQGLPVTVRRRRRNPVPLVTAAIVCIAAVALVLRYRKVPDSAGTATLAVGLIADHRSGAENAGTSPVTDLLATNLARIPTLHVVSTARLYELMEPSGDDSRPDAGAYSRAARRAGASMLIDGSLYAAGDGLRLDLRRIDLTSGEVLSVESSTAGDLFALVDSGTSRLAARFGADTPLGSVAQVTTHSETAYRLYQEGLREFYRGDRVAARSLLDAALREDSTLAMASYYLARATPNADAIPVIMERALRMADHASERERLIIQTSWALQTMDPGATASASTLITRFPDELDGRLFAGQAYSIAGDFAAALPLLRGVIVADSITPASASGRCPGCDARLQLIQLYMAVDSLAAAEREAVVWTEFQPDRAASWLYLSFVRSQLGQRDGAIDAYGRAARIDATLIGQPSFFGRAYLAVDDYDRVDRELLEITRSGLPDRIPEAWWYLALSYRQQGRLREALEAARACRQSATAATPHLTTQTYALLYAHVLFESGRYAESAAIFDSIARYPTGWSDSHRSRIRTIALSLGANPLAALGDTARLAARVDTVMRVGTGSLAARDRLAHYHVRGLLLAARGDDAGAISEFRLALSAPTGYSRTRYELARAQLRLGRPREAVEAMQPAINAPLEGAALYVTTTDRRALLAEAWDAAGQPDSALVYYRVVLDAWRRADPEFGDRVRRIRQRIAALEPAGTTTVSR